MKKLIPLIATLVFTLFILSRCKSPLLPQPAGYYIEVDSLKKVEMNNVYGKFTLSKNQLVRFKKEFSKCTSEPGLQIKTGSMAIILTRKDGKTFVARGNSNSNFLEISSGVATLNTGELSDTEWLVFNTNGINFNNYKRR